MKLCVMTMFLLLAPANCEESALTENTHGVASE